VLLSLRKKAAAAITFSTTLPQPQVGVAYTGSITATNVDGATGAITLTPTGLPAGLSLGTRTGSGPYTWPVTGTPTTAGAFSASFAATNGTQSASYAWSGSVSATGLIDASPPQVLQPSSTNKNTMIATLPNAVQVGDQIVVACSFQTIVTFTFSDSQGNTYTESAIQTASFGAMQAAVATAGAAGAAGTVTVQVTPNVNANCNAVVYHKRGGTLAIDTSNVAGYNSPAQPLNTSVTVGPYNTSARAFVVCMIGDNLTGGTLTFTGAGSWTTDLTGSGTGIRWSAILSKTSTTALSGDSFSYAGTASSSQRSAYLLVPFTY
jgi:hypothetical protein